MSELGVGNAIRVSKSNQQSHNRKGVNSNLFTPFLIIIPEYREADVLPVMLLLSEVQ